MCMRYSGVGLLFLEGVGLVGFGGFMCGAKPDPDRGVPGGTFGGISGGTWAEPLGGPLGDPSGDPSGNTQGNSPGSVAYTHLRAHETPEHLVCRLRLEKKNLHDDH